MYYTDEQAAIICDSSKTPLIVKAYAGTGKTFTMTEYSKKQFDKRILYLAFNNSAVKDAKGRFGPNTECKTFHKLALDSPFGVLMPKVLLGITLKSIADLMNCTTVLAKIYLEIIENYCASADTLLSDSHVPENYVGTPNIVEKSQQLYGLMSDAKHPYVPSTHSVYLKEYQLSNSILDYDVIIVDEAQDINPCQAEIAFSQPEHIKLILVGDEHQQIYRFRGADNALATATERRDNCDVKYLTQSFRFGESIAQKANAILSLKEELEYPVRGNPAIITQIRDGTKFERNQKKINDVISAERKKDKKKPLEEMDLEAEMLIKPTIITRTNGACIYWAYRWARKGKKIWWCGGIKGYGLDFLIDIHHFKTGANKLIQNKSIIKEYKTYQNMVTHAKQTEDVSLNSAINISKKYGKNASGVMKYLYKMSVSKYEDADMAVSTAHKSKGLEWPTVVVGNDFQNPKSMMEIAVTDVEEFYDELNLMYVAYTRGERILCTSPKIEELIF